MRIETKPTLRSMNSCASSTGPSTNVPTVQPPHQDDIDLPAPRRIDQLLALFACNGTGAHLSTNRFHANERLSR